MEKKSNKLIWVIILILSMIITIALVVFLSMTMLSKGPSREELFPDSTTLTSEEEVSYLDPESEIILIDNPIDFKTLKDKNPDIYAWINIPDTNIDYPVVQAGDGKDDFFYLNHNIDQKYEFAGSIYSEKQNALDFSDPVTVLYGHNMLNDTMFADLHKFKDSKFFKKHKYVYIYTPGHKLTYRVYAAYVYDNRHILNSFDFKDVEVVKSYFEYTTNPTTMTRNIRSDIVLTEHDTILTLSTCTGSNATRYLVQGVLIKDELTR